MAVVITETLSSVSCLSQGRAALREEPLATRFRRWETLGVAPQQNRAQRHDSLHNPLPSTKDRKAEHTLPFTRGAAKSPRMFPYRAFNTLYESEADIKLETTSPVCASFASPSEYGNSFVLATYGANAPAQSANFKCRFKEADWMRGMSAASAVPKRRTLDRKCL